MNCRFIRHGVVLRHPKRPGRRATIRPVGAVGRMDHHGLRSVTPAPANQRMELTGRTVTARAVVLHRQLIRHVKRASNVMISSHEKTGSSPSLVQIVAQRLVRDDWRVRGCRGCVGDELFIGVRHAVCVAVQGRSKTNNARVSG